MNAEEICHFDFHKINFNTSQMPNKAAIWIIQCRFYF